MLERPRTFKNIVASHCKNGHRCLQDLFEGRELEPLPSVAVRMTFCDMITAIFIPWTAFAAGCGRFMIL